MPQKLVWTPPRDAVLCRLRAEGATWDVIASELAITRNAAIERARRLGARLPPAPRAPPRPDLNRPPLRAGATESWSAILCGSILEGNEFIWINPLDRLGSYQPPIPT